MTDMIKAISLFATNKYQFNVVEEFPFDVACIRPQVFGNTEKRIGYFKRMTGNIFWLTPNLFQQKAENQKDRKKT